MRDVVEALDYAQGKGYLHRDVSLGNVMWDPVRERGCLIDWHIACRLGDASDAFSGLSITGTRLYTAVGLSRPGHQRCVQVCVGDVSSKLGLVPLSDLVGLARQTCKCCFRSNPVAFAEIVRFCHL